MSSVAVSRSTPLSEAKMPVATSIRASALSCAGAGSLRVYDQDGNLVLHDAGSFRYSFDIDYQGTPGDPSDDTEVPDSFQVIRQPTGRDDTSDRDFCSDVLEFTTP